MRNSISLVSMTFFTKGIRLLSMIIMVRYYDPPTFGRFALLIATTELFRVFADFGVDITITKWFSDRSRNRQEVQQSAAVLKLALACAAAFAVILAALSLGYSGELFWGIVVASTSYFLVSLGNLWRAEFQADLKMGELILPTFIVNSLYLVGFIVGVGFRVSLPWLMALGAVCDASMLLFLANGRLRTLFRKPSRSLVRDIFVTSTPIGLFGLFVVTYARVSTLILAELLGDTSVGQFTSALRLMEGMLIVTGAFASSMLPLLTERFLIAGSTQNLESLMSRFLRKLGFSVIGMAMALNLFSQAILSLLFTKEYLVAHQALSVLSWSLIFASVNHFFTNVLFARDRQRSVLWISAINCGFNISLSFLLIPGHGILGAALAMAITEFTNMLLQGWVVIHTSHVRLFRALTPMVLSRFGLWLVTLLMINLLVPNGVSGFVAGAIMVAYMVHLLLFKDIDFHEMRQAALSFVSLGMK